MNTQGPIIRGLLRGEIPTTILCRGCADYMADDLIAKSQPDMVTPECFRCNPALDAMPQPAPTQAPTQGEVVLSPHFAITVNVPPAPRIGRILRDIETGSVAIEYEETA